jgi:hypothetical protein
MTIVLYRTNLQTVGFVTQGKHIKTGVWLGYPSIKSIHFEEGCAMDIQTKYTYN